MKITIVAELCGQWGGDVKRAERMMLQAKIAGADYAKVQLWNTYEMPGENREKWEYLQMDNPTFVRLAQYGDMIGLPVFASCFNEEYFRHTRSYTPIFKIASMLLEHNFELAQTIANTKGSVWCSLGKWDVATQGIPFESPRITYFHCIAKYPHTHEEALAAMPAEFSGQMKGYSCHALGIDAAKEAINRGATIIEKHFTTDKALQSETEGAHSCSMTMTELEELRKYADLYVQSNRNQ